MKNPICAILWQDAAYSFEKELPIEKQEPRLTVGFIIEANDDYTFIATNVSYDRENKTLSPVDGFIIPEKAIVDFKAIGQYEQ